MWCLRAAVLCVGIVEAHLSKNRMDFPTFGSIRTVLYPVPLTLLRPATLTLLWPAILRYARPSPGGPVNFHRGSLINLGIDIIPQFWTSVEGHFQTRTEA